MEDAAGNSIWCSDTVAFMSSPARVLRPSGRTPTTIYVQRVDGATVEAEAGDITVVNRSYLRPGMVVGSASDPGGQLGVVTAATTAVDLAVSEDGWQAVATGVSPAELRRVGRQLCIGDYVVSSSSSCGRWLGRVVEASLDVDVLFDDGGRCRVTEADRKLRPVGQNYHLYSYTNSRFYPGQRVSSGFFKASRWLSGSYWKPSYVQGTVTMVKMAGALVYWFASRHPDSPPPVDYQNLDDLIFFCSSYTSEWNVADRCFFCNYPADRESSSPYPACGRNIIKHHRQKPMRRRRRTLQTGRETMRFEFERPTSVADTRTKVDVLWQDGTRQRSLPSVSLRPFTPKNEHDFFPGQHVRRVLAAAVDDAQDKDNGVGDADGSPEPVVRGVVRSLDCKDQTVRVSWLRGDDNNEVDYDETVSAYHLGSIVDHNVFYGNIVIRSDGRSTEEEEHLPARDLSWVGHVLNLCDDGKVQVKWGDGNTTEVLPHEIVVVREERVAEMLSEIGGWVRDDESHDAQGETNQAEPTANTGNNSQGGNNTDDGPSATRIIARVCSVIIRLGTKVVEQGKRSFLVTGWTMVEASSNAGLAAPSENAEERAESIHGEGEGKAPADAIGGVEAIRFPQFDIVQSPPPDHRYLDNVGQSQDTTGRSWTKRVQREWKILENDLPDTIYVRAFEDRMDLLRAVMVGACGTPYQDGLFFFDLQLPPSYPDSPPLVNYRSLGLRVNPNLYPSGTVCLSLLGTFGGNDTELWSPESSTVLQVLVSIQGLVLTAQPYYNEAGYGSQVGTPMGQRNELPYSENTYLLSLQTMLHLLRRPPAGFEGFVRDHFCRKGQHVLRACEAYRKGCLVGTLDDEAKATEASTGRPCSAGFRLALDNIVPLLMVEFAEIGADASDQFDLLLCYQLPCLGPGLGHR